jgi:hypothetical protein
MVTGDNLLTASAKGEESNFINPMKPIGFINFEEN